VIDGVGGYGSTNLPSISGCVRYGEAGIAEGTEQVRGMVSNTYGTYVLVIALAE
jgi:hypothetical protein